MDMYLAKAHVTGSCALPASFAIIARKYSVKRINNIEISKEIVTGPIVISVITILAIKTSLKKNSGI